MEVIDLYDENRVFTGESITRGESIPEGKYKLSVHMWITNNKGEIYIQKRAGVRRLFPNLWENPGGGVVSGQDSLQTLYKEFEEELGSKLTGEYTLFKTLKREKDFVDIYHIRQELDIPSLNLQADEVAEAKWASLAEINEMIDRGDFCPTIRDSFDIFEEYYKSIL